MELAAISLGSNLGNRLENLQYGIVQLRSGGLNLVRQSSVYETPAVGYVSDNYFLNQCILVETILNPSDLLSLLLEIEQKAGRVRIQGKTSDRTLDLDLLFYGQLVVNSNDLTLPHPSMHKRAFVLIPLYEIYPDWKHPIHGLSVAEMHSKLTGHSY
jgi:2-amino-4-hydroxy-6-hydroxymethyldihydropteridine diphosphokinase